MGMVSDLVSRGVRVLVGDPGPENAEIPAEYFESPRRGALRSALPIDVDTFTTVYEEARVPEAPRGYGVEKLVEILDSRRLAALPREVKVAAVLASLDAAGASLADVVRDAVVRDRAVDDFVAGKEQEVAALESRNDARMEQLRSEVEAYAAKREAEISRLREESDKAAAAFAQLQARKAREAERLHDVVAHFVPAADNPIPDPRVPAGTEPLRG